MPDFCNTKLAKLLALLDPKECKLFAKWLDSPWRNNNPRLPPFYRLLLHYYPGFDQVRCQQEHLYLTLYPGQNYQSKTMRHLMSELGKQVERFLIQQQLQKNTLQQQLLLQEAYLERHQTEWFEKSSQRTIADLEAQPSRSWTDLLQLCLLNEGLYFQPDTTVRHQPEQRVLHRANHYLDAFYALFKYRLAFEFEERRKIMRGAQEVEVDLPALRRIKDRLGDPALLIFEEHLSIEQPLALERYYEIKGLTLRHMEELSRRNQRDFLYALINKASRLLLKGHEGMHEEVIELYKVGLARELVISKGRMTDYTFSNIVVLNNLLQRYAEAIDFAYTYHTALTEEYQKDGLTWAQANTYYHSGNYQSAIDHLVDYSFSNGTYDLQGRVLLLHAYFDVFLEDRSYYSYLFDYGNAFERFVQRSRYYSKQKKSAITALIRYTRKLSKLQDQYQLSERSLDHIYEQVRSDKSIYAKAWLIKKINNLKDGMG